MADAAPLPDASVRLVDPESHRPTEPYFRWFGALNRLLGAAQSNVSTLQTGKAALSQVIAASFLFKFPEDETVTVILKCPFAWVITEVATKTEVGTATVTVKIDGVALGGSANAASTAEQAQAHGSANSVAADQDVQITFSATSADAENLAVTLKGTRTLA